MTKEELLATVTVGDITDPRVLRIIDGLQASLRDHRAEITRQRIVVDAARKVLPLWRGCRIHEYETALRHQIEGYDAAKCLIA